VIVIVRLADDGSVLAELLIVKGRITKRPCSTEPRYFEPS
jgi:hypothetical protein